MNGSWIENYTFQRGVPMRLADMTPEQRRYWQNENARRANRRRIEDRALRMPPDATAAGGKLKTGGINTMHRKMAERARKAKQKALDEHKGSAAMIAARDLQTRGHVVYSLGILGDAYGGPQRDLWVVDLRDYPVPTSTMIEWAENGIPSREKRLAAAVRLLRPHRDKLPTDSDNGAKARALLESFQRRHQLSEAALRAVVGSAVLFTLDSGGNPTNQTLRRMRTRIEEYDRDRGIVDVERIEAVGNLRCIIKRTMERYGLSGTALSTAAADDKDLVYRILRGATPKPHNEARLRAYIAMLDEGEVTL